LPHVAVHQQAAHAVDGPLGPAYRAICSESRRFFAKRTLSVYWPEARITFGIKDVGKMNVLIWLLGGAVAGWITCSVLQLDVARGLTVSTIIGIVGAFFGGNALAPAPALTGFPGASVLSPFAVLVASVSAIACLKIAGMLHKISFERSADNAKGL
jgi:uncharacterized membrane protein YeaQ/YmgE (transglycosylase-associated protein family)